MSLSKLKLLRHLNNLFEFNSARNLSVTCRTWAGNKELSYSYSQFPIQLIGATIGDSLDRMAQKRPNHVAYNFSSSQIKYTFIELKQRVDELAQSLLHMGFRKGDKLALLLPNVPELFVTVLAAGSIGVVSVLMNPAYQMVEIEYMLKKTNAKGVIMLDSLKTLNHYEIMRKICPELDTATRGELNSKKLPDLKHVIIASLMPNASNQDKFKGAWLFDQISGNLSNKLHDVPHIDIDDDFILMYFSIIILLLCFILNKTSLL